MPSKCRVHKYYYGRRVGRDRVWSCALGCNHHMPKHQEEMMENKPTICWECGSEDCRITFLHMEEARTTGTCKPTCDECAGIAVTRKDPFMEALRRNEERRNKKLEEMNMKKPEIPETLEEYIEQKLAKTPETSEDLPPCRVCGVNRCLSVDNPRCINCIKAMRYA